MKMFGNAFSSAVDALSNWKFVGKKFGGKARSRDYGILEVAMMVSALDGAISPKTRHVDWLNCMIADYEAMVSLAEVK